MRTTYFAVSSETDLSLCLLDCRKGGKYFYKRDRGFYQYERPNFLAVEDPQDLGNDLAKGSYAVDKARPLYLPANTWLIVCMSVPRSPLPSAPIATLTG